MLQLDRRRLMPLRPRLAPLPPLLGGCLALTLASPAPAEQIDMAFQSGFMRQAPGQPAEAGALALRHLATQARLPPGRYRVNLTLNFDTLPEQELDFVEAPHGDGLQPCLTAELLRSLNLREQALEAPLTAHAINEMQVRQGVGANQDVTVPKTFLATLKRNAQFTLHVQVSFDDGAHWVDFPEYHPVLRA